VGLDSGDADRVLGAFEVFRAAERALAQRFVSGGQRLSFEAGSRILEEGDASEHAFALVEGTVGVFYSASKGTNVLVKVFGPPALFGEMELPFGLPRMEYVEVFENATIIRWDGASFLDFLRSDTAAAFAMFQDVAARLCISAYLERALAFQDVETRAAGLFLSLLDSKNEAHEIPFRLTYPMIARCLGATEKSVERTIGRWLGEGWLERNRGRYTIADLSELKAKADPELLLLHSRIGQGPTRVAE
jgi:CRP-like cAMP-binding protein